MKKLSALLLCLILLATLFAGCNSNNQSSDADIKVVTTVFPLYDWVREVAQDDVHIDLDLLLDNGVDLHSYQPTAKDIMNISDCDVFVYVGGESDQWVADTLDQADNKDMVVIDLMDVLGDKAKEEELKEGMQGEEEEETEEEPEYDEHVWLSLKNAALFTQSIADALKTADSQHADSYQANADAYIDKLNALDAQYQQTVDSAAVRTLLFGDRFPFRYLTDDYGLDYYAAFVGCSAESEASFETITFLANKVDELGLKAIMKIETSDGSIAQTVRDNTKTKDQQILTLDSMQAVTADRAAAGETYLSIMESNLEVLKASLS
ncbi:MAG: zinc ABC transporter substrate-binding protein [Ruminococcus sp.]|uniref:metal ABC transporter substrate-binding protein n=1 Tax=Ruminococcus sp. TaxID=41978 RepID=UPI00287350B7|nr:metal ABC transporter substrate-binding protein [Ruminococcus sp.]MBQ3284714.1 zinc ABC transporter substrate-binding protein [Ruminococcus sp.]